MVVPAAALVAVLVAGGYFYFHRTPKLAEQDTIVLADFTNTTGDPVFDGTLRQGLAVQLEQSPFLRVISDERVQQTLRLMGQPADTRLTPAVAQQLCRRTGSAVVVEGSIEKLGVAYVVGVNALNCRTSEILARDQITSEDSGRTAPF